MIGRFLLSGVALSVLAACQPTLPDSNPLAGSAQRDAQLARSTTGTLSAAQPVETAPLDSDPATQPLPDGVVSAVNEDDAERRAAREANSGVAPLEASPSNPAPAVVNEAGISSEQDFDAVSSQRSIQSDADRIAANRAQYTLIAPTDVPKRPGSNQPNIVEYALRTSNPVGAQLYRRFGLRSAQRHANACARFASADQAQMEFLARGGPERDRKGLDPDGDGFACTWDPGPFRAARAASQPVVEESQVPAAVEPLIISTE